MQPQQPIDSITGGQVKAILNDLPKTFSQDEFIKATSTNLKTTESQLFKFQCFLLLRRIEAKGLIRSVFKAMVKLPRWIEDEEGDKTQDVALVIHFQKV